jgi:ribose transport system ATP-binding protein
VARVVTRGESPLTSGPPSALDVRGLTKTFAGRRVLSAFDLDVSPGEIHAVVGENGSGKSTFIKILAGRYSPDADAGEVFVSGRRLQFGSVGASYGLGCRFVHQDLGLIDEASIVDNLCLMAGFPTTYGTVRGSVARDTARTDLLRVGLNVDPRTLVGDLSPAVKTGVAVARALRIDPRSPASVLVLDEPTATLPDSEVQHLLEIVRRVADGGIGVVYVTHRLDEVFMLANRVSVLRDGDKITTAEVGSTNRRELVGLIIGSELAELEQTGHVGVSEGRSAILEVRGLSSATLRDVSLTVRPGEIVGIAGITGSGRETILSTVFGATDRSSGEVLVGTTGLASNRPDVAVQAGVGYLPPDRKRLSGLMDLTGRENLTLASLRRFWRRWRLQGKAERAEVLAWFERLSVRPSTGMEQPLSTFSGGNQQKILFAKWLRIAPRVFLLDEPSQGVDVGARALLHRQLLASAAEGMAVVVASTDFDELVALCDRVLVLRDGRVSAELVGSDVSVAKITHECLMDRAGALA